MLLALYVKVQSTGLSCECMMHKTPAILCCPYAPKSGSKKLPKKIGSRVDAANYATYIYIEDDLSNSIFGRCTVMKARACGMLFLVLILGFFLAGCGCFIQAQKGEAPPPKPPEAQKMMPPEAKKEVPMPPPPPPPPMAAPVLNNIYFDFDRYNIRPGDAEILKKNLDWFKANSMTKVRIEGNCDERGTVEYNLALGQKRADAAKNYLTGLGVNGKNLDTISYGKERPVCTEHNEGCWAQNRRDAFVPIK